MSKSIKKDLKHVQIETYKAIYTRMVTRAIIGLCLGLVIWGCCCTHKKSEIKLKPVATQPAATKPVAEAKLSPQTKPVSSQATTATAPKTQDAKVKPVVRSVVIDKVNKISPTKPTIQYTDYVLVAILGLIIVSLAIITRKK